MPPGHRQAPFRPFFFPKIIVPDRKGKPIGRVIPSSSQKRVDRQIVDFALFNP
jgi:hypothetical protein